MGNTLKHPNIQIVYHQLPAGKGISVTSAALQGWRQHMEDFSSISQLKDQILFAAVFDGHGGPQVAYYASQHLPQIIKRDPFFMGGNYYRALVQSFKKLDQKIGSYEGQLDLKQVQKQYHSQMSINKQQLNQDIGSTANAVIITPQKIFAANIGDTRSVLCRSGKAIPLSHDHKPQNPIQKDRIKNAGGYIHHKRINGLINVSRAFGDFYFKNNKHKSASQQMEIQRDKSQDQYIVIASDGVWQKFGCNYQELIDVLNQLIIKAEDWKDALRQFLHSLVPEVLTQACTGVDNMTIVLILMDVWRLSSSSTSNNN